MSDRDDATLLLDSFDRYSPAPKDGRVPKIGIVKTVPATGHVTILFDGETGVGAKVYPCLTSYPGTVGDRVIVLPVGSRTSWIVLGAITP